MSGYARAGCRLARLMWSAFQCGTYARLSDDENEQTRLFLVGIKAGREFLDAVNKGQITDEAKRNVGPAVVMDVLGFTSRPIGEDMLKNVGGPSADFVLGRIVKNATSTAYNMAKVAEAGTTGYVPGGFADVARTKLNAQTKYSVGNCVLVK
jgi:hypothetical protein